MSRTVPIRVPTEVYDQVRQWSGLMGLTAGEVLQQAWDQWVATHREAILADLDALRAKIEAGKR